MQLTKADRLLHGQLQDAVAKVAEVTSNMTVKEMTEKFGGGSNAGHLYSILILAGHYCNNYEQPSSRYEWTERLSELVRIGDFITDNLVHQIFVDTEVDEDLIL